MTILAHFTGLPHHVEETSLLTFWPLILLALQLVWVIIRQRTTQALRAARAFLREATPIAGAFLGWMLVYALVQFTQAAPSTPPPAPATVTLRNAQQHVIGTVATRAGGVLELRNAQQHVLGTYDPRTNQTRNAQQHVIAEGNVLGLLLN